MSKEELDKHEEWLGWQAWTLAAGLACGLLANLLVRRHQLAGFSSGGIPGEASGSAASRVASLGAVSASNKMVLVVRADLEMGRGKACSQCAHAALECYRRASLEAPRLIRQWEAFGEKKVALRTMGKGNGEEELEELRKAAEEAGLAAALIRDEGRTELESGTPTVLGLGPGPESIVDGVTGHLQPY